MGRFIKAEPGPRNTVTSYSEDGKRFQYSGGDPALIDSLRISLTFGD